MAVRLKHRVENICVRALAGLLQRLSYRGALRVGCAVAWIAHYVGRYRVVAGRARIREIFGASLTERDVKRIAWSSWRNFIFSVVEMSRIPVSTPDWVRSIVDDGGTLIKVQDHLKTGAGGILAIFHMGSWEMAALSCMTYHITLFSIAAQQKNPLVDDYMNYLRSKTGFETILRDNSMLKGVIRKIREGKVLAILPDVRSKTPALSIRFLGKTANIAEGMGYIAKQTGVPIFPCLITRIGWDRHQYRVCDPIFPDPALDKRADAGRMTQQVFDIFDAAIRANPDQWFWFNKRWLFDPL